MKNILPLLFLAFIAVSCGTSDNLDMVAEYYADDIPLPEHPRPDWERETWLNLNGQWGFASDPDDNGEYENWFAAELDSVFNQAITVPFSWASPLSGIGRNNFDFGWYMREIMIPRGGDWTGKRYWLVIGASDFTTTLWVNGEMVGEHEGGYTPMEFDITDYLSGGTLDRLVIRCEDLGFNDRPEGLQFLGDAKGIWQTVYLEGRSPEYIEYARFSPDIDSSRVNVTVKLAEPATEHMIFSIAFEDETLDTFAEDLLAGTDSITYTIPIPDQHLWTLNDPFLYNVSLGLDSETGVLDRVYSYFGMREIDTAPLPDSDDWYVTLNGQPVYLRMALDHGVDPAGFYTFPDDETIQNEIIRARQLGLNGIRIHAKTEIPRKLYWADRYGLLVMADIPNWWGDIDDDAKAYWEETAERQIARDFNHPSIFSWVLFDEARGISTVNINGIEIYLPQSQDWVRGMYGRITALDPTRLVDDNASSRGWHLETDLNTWQRHMPGRRWAATLDEIAANISPGSAWNFTGNGTQTAAPSLSTSSGPFWAYTNGTGDIDLSYEYHQMVNEFRRRREIAGYTFNQLYDAVNEWDGFYRYDRGLKEFGLDDLCTGMTIADFHTDLYLIPGDGFDMVVAPDSTFMMPVTASFLAPVSPVRLTVETRLHGWNRLGEHIEYGSGSFDMVARPYAVYELPPVQVTAPPEDCLAVWTTTLLAPDGTVLHHNFVPFRAASPDTAQTISVSVPYTAPSGQLTFKSIPTRIENRDAETLILRQQPADYAAANWSITTGTVLNGLKIHGAGIGYFEFAFPVPEGLDPSEIASVVFRAEVSSHQLPLHDQISAAVVPHTPVTVDEAHRNPTYSPNSYPQTDAMIHQSRLLVSLNGENAYDIVLDDAPADHRGLLSWMSQPVYDRSWFLFEPGSYGYLVSAAFGEAAAQAAAQTGELRIHLEVPTSDDNSGGLAVYGSEFGRYPMDVTMVIRRK